MSYYETVAGEPTSKLGADAWLKPGTDDERIAKHRAERADHGMSFYDWINAESFILGIIAQAARKFREEGAGYPSASSEEHWHATLESIYEPIEKYLAIEELGDDPTPAQLSAVKIALVTFAEHFMDFWD